MKTYVIVNLIEQPPSDCFRSTEMTLHLTLSNTFFSNMPVQEILQILKELKSKHKSFIVRTKTRELFGENNDILVTEVARSKELLKLHFDIVESINDLVFKKPEFAMENYRPHITDQGGKSIRVNEEIKVNNFTLFELSKELLRLHGTVELK